jgi:hypothetical protein
MVQNWYHTEATIEYMGNSSGWAYSMRSYRISLLGVSSDISTSLTMSILIGIAVVSTVQITFHSMQ